MFDFKGQVAVVTGASSGLGKQLALALAKRGANLVILARRLERLEKFAPELEKAGAKKVLAIKCDVTSTDDIENAAKQTLEEFGKVDILLNCAGAAKNNGVINMTDEEWDFTIAADETSVFKMTRAFAKIMQKNKYGRIINIASMYGLVGNTEIHTVAYHASKGAVVNFTRAVAAELATDGYFYTELTSDTLDTKKFQDFAKSHVPMQRYGEAGELDAALLFLASREASYVTGVILPVDGGYTAI